MPKKSTKKESIHAMKMRHAAELAALQVAAEQNKRSANDYLRQLEEIAGMLGVRWGGSVSQGIREEITRLKMFRTEHEVRTPIATALLQEENARLFRLVRVALKDPGVEPLPEDSQKFQERQTHYPF